MANDLNPLEGRLDHRRGQGQPTKEGSSSSDHATARPSGANQEASLEARNAPVGTSQPAELSRATALKPVDIGDVPVVNVLEKRVRT